MATHAGAVTFRKLNGQTRYLIVSATDAEQWVLPKGHIEPGESAEATALRELREEAGVTGEIVAPLIKQKFRKPNEEVTVQYFLVRGLSYEQSGEKRSVRWEDEETALRLLSFPEAREALRKAITVVGEDSLEIVREILKVNKCRLKKESKRHKRIHRIGQSLVIILTAVTTIASGSGLFLRDERYKATAQFSVLCLTAATSALAAWIAMRRARELWQHEIEMYYSLLDIEREIEFYAAHTGIGEREVEAYFQQISRVMKSGLTNWGSIQQEKTAKTTKE